VQIAAKQCKQNALRMALSRVAVTARADNGAIEPVHGSLGLGPAYRSLMTFRYGRSRLRVCIYTAPQATQLNVCKSSLRVGQYPVLFLVRP
jgi:hypothetical protein